MEKTLFSQTSEVRGKQKEGHFTTSFQFYPEEEVVKQTRGSLFFLISSKEVSRDKALGVAKGVFDSFKEKFYTAEGSNLKALEEVADFIKSNLKQAGVSVDLLVANLWGSVLYVTKIGDAGVLLVRDGTAKKIDIVKAASGALEDRDLVLLADSLFTQTLSQEALAEAASKEDFESVIAALEREQAEKEGVAFAVMFSVSEPLEAIQPILVADLDKTAGKLVFPIGFLQKEAEKLRFRIPRMNVKFKFLQGKEKVAKEYWQKVQVFGGQLARKTWVFVITPWLPRTPGSLEEAATKKRQRIAQIAVVLATILILSVVIGGINRARTVSRERHEATIASIESKLEDAENLKDINPAQARTLVSEAEGEIEKLSAKDAKVSALVKKIDRLLAEINKIYKVSIKKLADLSALKGGVDTQELKIQGSTLFVFDKGTGSVYKVSTGSGDPSILVSEKKGLTNIAVFAGGLYLQTKDGIFKANLESGEDTQVAPTSSDWKGLQEADTYRDNFYLLDTGARQIWKYVPGGSESLVGPTPYFSEKFGGTSVSLAVDASIWVATKKSVFKYFAGRRDKFSIEATPTSFSEIVDIYTSEAAKNLYILDKKEGVFIIEKASGKYLGLYKNSKFEKVESLATDEAKKKTYLLIENAVYVLELR